GIKIVLKKGGDLWDDLNNVIYNNITSKIICQECPAGVAKVSNLSGNTSKNLLKLYDNARTKIVEGTYVKLKNGIIKVSDAWVRK
ncbi:hypothetical protein, partial [Defluviitalea phaphyphila]|uniref:hypothetical protein n=1 Tax=Defluviitalea phaphyphila TaxID=1473580 RepID=UPI001365451A